MLRYRFQFVGARPRPRPNHVYRDAPIVQGTLELYSATRYVVESVDEEENPPVAVLRKVRRL